MELSEIEKLLVSRNRYDDDVIIGILSFIKNNPQNNVLRLRPNGVDVLVSRPLDLEALIKKFPHWNAEWVVYNEN